MISVMAKQISLRASLKWTGFLTTLCLISLWLVGIRWRCEYAWDDSKPRPHFVLVSGVIGFWLPHTPLPPAPDRINAWHAEVSNMQSSLLPLAQRLGLCWPAKQKTPWATEYSLPLWLPLLITAIPTIAVFWIDVRRASACHPTDTHKFERWGKFASILVGIGTFIVLLWVADFVVEAVCLGLCGKEFFRYPPSPAPPPVLRFAIPLIVVIVIAYVGARLTYKRARWRWIAASSEVCRCCGYNLTGNVSGICPECGTPVVPGSGRVGR